MCSKKLEVEMAFLWLLIGLVIGAAVTYYLLELHPKMKQVYKDGVPK